MSVHAAGPLQRELVPSNLGERVAALETDLSTRMNATRARFWRRTDPEIVRVWGRIVNDLTDVQLLLDRSATSEPGAASALESLLATRPEAGSPWTLEFAREFAHSLRALVPLFADAVYLRAVIGSKKARERFENTFGKERLAEVEKWLRQDAPTAAQVAAVASELRTIALFRANKRRKAHARLALRAEMLWRMLILLLALVLGTAAVLVWAGDSTGSFVLVAASTGALGSILSGFFKLRDDLHRLTDLRAFRAALFVQPLVGAAAGLLAFLAVEAGVLSIPSSAGAPAFTPYGVYGFIAGFSEPFLLGVVRRLTPDQPGGEESGSKAS